MLYKKYIVALVLLLIVVVGIFLFAKRGQAPDVINEVVKQEEEIKVPKNENIEVPATPTNAVSSTTYKELITAGHKLYLQEKYAEALPYFKKALMLEQSDRIYRSLYSVYMGLKDYTNAEISIKKSVTINRQIPNNWLEYASFENYYKKASFDVVSKVYLDGLKATKDHIDLITNYAGYLTENKKYTEAITYLEKAISIDSSRKDIFQTEIDNLRTL